MNAFIRDGAPRPRKRRAERKNDRRNAKKMKSGDHRRSPSSVAVVNDIPVRLPNHQKNSNSFVCDSVPVHEKRHRDKLDATSRKLDEDVVDLIDLTATEDDDDACDHDTARESFTVELESVSSECEEDSSYPAEFIQARQRVFDDFKKSDKLYMNEKLNDFLQSFDENKKKQFLKKMFEQCYKVSEGSLEKSVQMIQHLQIKTYVLSVNDKSIISSLKYEEKLPTRPIKDIITNINTEEENKLKLRISKQILKLFGEQYHESDSEILFQSPICNKICPTNITDIDSISVENKILENDNIIDLDESNDTPYLTKNSFGLTIRPKVTDGRTVVAHPIICDNTSTQSNSNVINKSNTKTYSIVSHSNEENTKKVQKDNKSDLKVADGRTIVAHPIICDNTSTQSNSNFINKSSTKTYSIVSHSNEENTKKDNKNDPKVTDSCTVVAHPIICDNTSTQSNSNFIKKSSTKTYSIVSHSNEENTKKDIKNYPKVIDSRTVVAHPIICDNTSTQSNSNFINKSSTKTYSIASHSNEKNTKEVLEVNISDQNIINSETEINIEIMNTSDNEKQKLECSLTYVQTVTEIELKICKVINPNDDIYKNVIIKQLASYFSNNDLYCELDSEWKSTESKLIGELIVKLFEQFNNTDRNMAYLSGCLICVFRETIKSFCAPKKFKKQLIVFINCIKKYAKHYDTEFWRTWFVPDMFIDWCFILTCVFFKNVDITASLIDNSIMKNAMVYFAKLMHQRYVFTNCHDKKFKPLSGIFEPSNSDDLFDNIIECSEEISETATNISIDETVVEICPVPEHPKITVCSEFSISNSFKNKFCLIEFNDQKSKEPELCNNDLNQVTCNKNTSSNGIEAKNSNEVQENPRANNYENQPTVRNNDMDKNAKKKSTKREKKELPSQTAFYTVGNNPQRFSIVCTSNVEPTQSSCPIDIPQPLINLNTQPANVMNIQLPSVTNTQPSNVSEIRPENAMNVLPSNTRTRPSNAMRIQLPNATYAVPPNAMNIEPSYSMDTPQTSNATNIQPSYPKKKKKYTRISSNIPKPPCCKKTQDVNATFTQLPNVNHSRSVNNINTQLSNIMNSQNSDGMNSQFSDIMNSTNTMNLTNILNPYSMIPQPPYNMNFQPTTTMDIQPSSTMNSQNLNIMNTQYSSKVNSQNTNIMNTQLASSMHSQNSVQMNNQRSANLNYRSSNDIIIQPNQSVTNGQHNLTSNDGYNNSTHHQYNIYNNVVNFTNVNGSSNHNVIPSLSNTHSLNHDTTLSPQPSYYNYSSTTSTFPRCLYPKYPVEYTNIQPPPYKTLPCVASSSTSINRISLGHNYGNFQCSNNCNLSHTSAIHQPVRTTENYQPPDYNSQVSPDLPDTQVSSMPNQMGFNSYDMLPMCMAPDCLNSSKYRCNLCLEARYCSFQCQKTDWHYHKNECHKQ